VPHNPHTVAPVRRAIWDKVGINYCCGVATAAAPSTASRAQAAPLARLPRSAGSGPSRASQRAVLYVLKDLALSSVAQLPQSVALARLNHIMYPSGSRRGVAMRPTMGPMFV